jgi:glycosyltransferase involved in cell wall biosynthesis
MTERISNNSVAHSREVRVAGHDKIAIILNCYPQTSETFIAQELLGLQWAGLTFEIVSLEKPRNLRRNTLNDKIVAVVHYLPFPMLALPSIFRAWRRCRKLPGYRKALRVLRGDLRRIGNPLLINQFARALMACDQLGEQVGHFHAHFMNRPAAIARYAAAITSLAWSCSAHAKDIWTQSRPNLIAALASSQWTVTCSRHGYERLRSLSPLPDRVHLSYHGLDMHRFSPFDEGRPPRTGSEPERPLQILSIARAVPKKGLDVLLRALSTLGGDFHWRLTHVGGGDQLSSLQRLARSLAISDRINWLGTRSQDEVFDFYRQADLFVLPCRTARNGDRDGVPNVLVEASSQRLPCISTAVPGVLEFLSNEESALLVPPDDTTALASAIRRLAIDPAFRARLARSAEQRVRQDFDYRSSVTFLLDLFEAGRPEKALS